MTLPTFFIIGAAKAGTTSLYHYLDQHPEIQMAAVKEPNFFSGRPGKYPYPRGSFIETRSEYERLFDPQVPVRGEASVGYSNFPRREGVPEAISELVPDAKFIYLVRDPVERIVSQYQYRVAVEGERRPMSEALDLDDPASVYVCPSRYGTQMDCYLKVFPRDRMLVIDQVELLRDRERALRKILFFLDVSTDLQQIDLSEQNTRKGNRRYPSAYLSLRNALGHSVLGALPYSFRRSLRGALERTLFPSVPPAQMDDDLRTRLEDMFAPEAERLRSQTGLEFSGWCV